MRINNNMPIKIIAGKDNVRAEIQVRELAMRNAKAIRLAFYKIGKDLKATASKLILEKPKGGKTYKIKRLSRRITHKSSAPGEAPANLSGRLRRSLDFNVIGSDRMEFGYRAGTGNSGGNAGVNYGKWLERGTNRMKARPGLFLAIKENEKNAVEHFETELKKELNQ